jgi:nucleoside-diphosphate-sugar epimerase
VADRVRELGEVAGWRGAVVSLSADQLPSHLRAPYQPRQDLVVDTGRLRTELGFAEKQTRQEGLRRTIDWERANPFSAGDPGAAEYAAEDAAFQRGRT